MPCLSLTRTAGVCGLVVACTPEPQEGVLTGIVTTGPEASAQTVEGAGVRTFGMDGNQLDDVVTAEDGSFQATVPYGGTFFIEIDGGEIPTAFSAVSQYGAVEGGHGDLWFRTGGQVEAIRSVYSACATAAEDGGIIEGEVQVYLAVNEAEDLPLITTATVQATAEDGTVYEACYLNNLGETEDALFWTGNTGRFAIFGVPAGLYDLEVEYWIPDYEGDIDTGNSDQRIETPRLPIRMPEGGVSVHYPLWASAPAAG